MAAAAGLVGLALGGSAPAEQNDATLDTSHRVVHRFDFDERAEGNLEDLPKYWMPFRPPGFPHFTMGQFDSDVGRTAPPSFYVSGRGRSAAYDYRGPDTRVRANCTYRIEGFIRPDRLHRARAALSAHFLDVHGDPLIETMVRSRYIGGPEETQGWVRVELYLPAAPIDAHSIGLIAWVLQAGDWDLEVPFARPIQQSDVHAGAWFDDLVIHALPRVEITTGWPGGVLPPGESHHLGVVLADRDDTALSGWLTIRAADGERVETHAIPVTVGTTADPIKVSLDHLRPGLYTAELRVLDRSSVIAARTLSFVRLARLSSERGAGGRAFGVVLDPGCRADGVSELAFLLHQGTRSAKWPVWTGRAEPEATATETRSRAAEQQELLKAGFALTGVFLGPPSALVREAGPYPRPLLELLAGESAGWQGHLATAAAPQASMIRWWQLGPDDPEWWSDRAPLDQGLSRLREALRQFITVPRLAVAIPSYGEPEESKLPVEGVSLVVGPATLPEQATGVLERARQERYERVSVYVPPLPADHFHRLPRLAEWVRRVITARHGGADTVFVPQTWQVREANSGLIAEPIEEYVLLRTIADLLGDAEPGGSVRVAEGVTCLAFHRGDESVLALWDLDAPMGGRRWPLQLGRADKQFDLWGQAQPLRRSSDGRQVVELSSLPVFVPGVERWLIDFRNSVTIEPKHVESGDDRSRHEIRLANQGTNVLSGELVLAAPADAELSERRISFYLLPQREERLPITVQFSHNAPAGTKELVAGITVAGTGYYLAVPLELELGLTDVEVWGTALVERGELRIRQVVTNRSAEVLHFRGAATVPGRQRQYRPFSNLGPGETQAAEYWFPSGAVFAGQSVRVGLREMADGPRIHTLELVVP